MSRNGQGVNASNLHLKPVNSLILVFGLLPLIAGGCFTHDYALPPQQFENPGILLTVQCQSETAAIVSAVINRQGPFRCMIDSGSRGCVVSPSVAALISPNSRSDVEYSDGDLVSIQSWSVSGIALADFDAVVSDPGDVDCILGANALTDLVVAWHPSARVIYLNADALIVDESKRIDVDLSGGRPFITLVVGGRR